MATPAELIAIIAPELVGNANLAAAIAYAETVIPADHCRRDAAVANMAAHMLTLGIRGGGISGAVSSVKEGDLAVSYGASSSTDALSQTSYGMELSRLNRICYGFTARTGWMCL